MPADGLSRHVIDSWSLANPMVATHVAVLAPESVAAEGIDSCRGMFPCLKIDHRGGTWIGRSMGLPPNRISLRFDGKVVPLLLPWEIDARALKQELRFDDWQDAVRAFNPRRLKRKVPSGNTLA